MLSDNKHNSPPQHIYTNHQAYQTVISLIEKIRNTHQKASYYAYSIDYFVQGVFDDAFGTCFFEFGYEVAHDALIDDDFDGDPVFVE